MIYNKVHCFGICQYATHFNQIEFDAEYDLI